MSRPHTIAVMLAATFAAGVAAGAQTSSVAVPIAQCAVADSDVLPTLTSAYERADDEGFERTASIVLASVRHCSADALTGADRALLDSLDLEKDYVALAWPAVNRLGEPALYSSVVHSGAGVHSRTLGGVGRGGAPRLVQILLAPSPTDRMAGVYLSDPERHPLGAQLPSFAAAIAGPVLAAFGTPQPAVRAVQSEAAPSAWASVARVELPFRRASIRADLRARIAPAAIAVEQQADALRRRMEFVEVPHVPCARALATHLASVLESLARTCADERQVCVQSAQEQFLAAYRSQEPGCEGATDAETRRNLQALLRVDDGFRTYVSEIGATPLEATLQLENVPPARFSLGIVSAYFAPAATTVVRAKVDQGVITPDPIRRQVSIIAVNGAFLPYDQGRPVPGWRERVRWFGGGVVTPEPGAAAGLSLLVVRGLAINIGAAVLAVRTPGPGETVGSAPQDHSAPLGVGAMYGGIAGLSYNFK
jgi:hypothetical protein